MSLLITLVIFLIILALVVWLVQTSPLPEPFRWAVMALVVLIGILFLVQKTGVLA